MKRCLALLLVLSFFSVGNLQSQEKDPIFQYEVLFSPQDHVAEELISLINKEKKSIKAAVFCLMHRGIATALIEAHKRGVDVEIIVDPFSVKQRSPVRRMAAANMPIYIWNPPTLLNARGGKQKRPKPLMHDKFCVLGGKRVWTGSFNFTYEGATRNQENVIVLESEYVASLYLKDFERLKEEGCMAYEEFVAVKTIRK